jgi:predicted Zn-dependent protease
LAKGELDDAQYQFAAVLSEYKDDVPALLGMAAIEVGRRQYKNALRRYKQALRVLPSNMPAVRVCVCASAGRGRGLEGSGVGGLGGARSH